jgi:hypothetical protein
MKSRQADNNAISPRAFFVWKEGIKFSAVLAKLAESLSESLTSLANLDDKAFVGYAVPPDVNHALC